jgi:hypothetical protein
MKSSLYDPEIFSQNWEEHLGFEFTMSIFFFDWDYISVYIPCL